MEKTGYVKLNVVDNTSMNAYFSLPEGGGSFPGILLFHEAFGINDHIKDIAGRIAVEGYVVIAPELYHRTAPGFQAAYTDFKATQEHIQALKTKELINDVTATYNWLQQQQNVIHNKTGSVGFCLGGTVSFLANIVLPLSAGVSFYGGGIHERIDRAHEIHSRHLFFWGGKDTHITADKRNAVTAAMDKAGKPYTHVVFSDAGHGFFRDPHTSYHPKAAREAWALVLEFYRNNMK